MSGGEPFLPAPFLPMTSADIERLADLVSDEDFALFDRAMADYLRSPERDSMLFARRLAVSSDADLIARGWDAAAIRSAVAAYPIAPATPAGASP